MATILKIYFSLLLLKRKPTDLKLGRKHRDDIDKRELKSFCLEMRDGHHGSHFENIFASSPEPKGQVTGKLVGSIGMTCRSKIAIIPIRNPRLLPSRKSIICFYS